MRLLDLQKIFTYNVAKLILHAYDEGYSLTYGEAWRTDEQAELNALGWLGRNAVAKCLRLEFPALAECIANNGKADGIRTSLHGDRLAVDFNLFQGSKLLIRSDDYLPLGIYWESLHPQNAWGGRFRPKPDGNHFSMSWQGRK